MQRKVELIFFDLPESYKVQDLLCEISNGIEENTKVLQLKTGGYVKLGKTKIVFGDAYECIICMKISNDSGYKETKTGLVCPKCLRLYNGDLE